jgi:hypothetical protein
MKLKQFSLVAGSFLISFETSRITFFAKGKELGRGIVGFDKELVI